MNIFLFPSSCAGVQGEQPGGAAERRGPGAHDRRQEQPQAGEEDQGAPHAAGGRATTRRSVQGTERKGEMETILLLAATTIILITIIDVLFSSIVDYESNEDYGSSVGRG